MSQHTDARPSATDGDLDWRHGAVQGVSWTFALMVDVLDEPMAPRIRARYLLYRIADAVEDSSSIAPDERAHLLRLYDRTLDSDDDATVDKFAAAVQPHLPSKGEQSDDWMVVANTARVSRTFETLPKGVREAVTPPIRELVSGMAMLVERYSQIGRLRIQSREKLGGYCYYTTGTVGNLITNLVTRGSVDSERRSRLCDTAKELDLLLQLMNITKDVYDDYTSENNVYLPADWLDDADVPQGEIVDPEYNNRTASVVARTAGHTKSFLDDTQTYLETVPLREGNTLTTRVIPFLLAIGTLRELVANPEHTVTGKGIKISRQEVFTVISEVNSASSEPLTEMHEIISRQPFHRATTNLD